MRGKHLAGQIMISLKRIIPAHAGQTCSALLTMGRKPDHPRACGANTYRDMLSKTGDGSSPRMRGKLPGVAGQDWRLRIIPAHAGQTACATCRASDRTDHPRACGANSSAVSKVSAMAGSSPRMRGKRRERHEQRHRRRIIPAHAGQTRPQPPRHPVSTDHPRACGANVALRLGRT